jgi:sugar phosphate isomerase/epimerase
MERRDFLKISGSSALGLALMPSLISSCAGAAQKSYGLGIYTVRDALEKDFKGTLKKLSEMGFTDLEFWNYNEGNIFGIPAIEVKKMMDDLGLKSTSLHAGITPLTNDFDRLLETASTLNEKYLVCNYLVESERTSLDDYKAHSDLLNMCGEKAKSAGITMGYHNHDFEFFDFDGQKPYDVLLDRCDKNLVRFEMDMYWMTASNQDPIAYFEKHPGRFPLWHVKDMNSEKQFTPVGEGIIDWNRIFAKADVAGLEQYFVEQDQSPSGDIFEDITKSLSYIKANKL